MLTADSGNTPLSPTLAYCALYMLVLVAIAIQSQHTELCLRLDFLWKLQVRVANIRGDSSVKQLQATEERIETEKLQQHNRQLLENVLPRHMTEYFLTANRSEEV